MGCRPLRGPSVKDVRDLYHEDLDGITSSLVDITRLAGEAIDRATTALLDADLGAAEAVITGDIAIDQLYADVEARALNLLARQQPVASDLRVIITSLRMVADVERMGDLALHIAKVARRRYPASAIPAELTGDMREMGQVAQHICAKCSEVIAGHDVEAAASWSATTTRWTRCTDDCSPCYWTRIGTAASRAPST